jgi:hypothetical protein
MSDTTETQPATAVQQSQPKSLTDKEWMEQMWPGGCIVFGTVDPNTGEEKEGHYDKNGMIAYRNPLPWWRRMLGHKSVQNVWSEWEFLCTDHIISFDRQKRVSVPIYLSTNHYTGKKRYAKRLCGEFIEIDPIAYEKGTVINK